VRMRTMPVQPGLEQRGSDGHAMSSWFGCTCGSASLKPTPAQSSEWKAGILQGRHTGRNRTQHHRQSSRESLIYCVSHYTHIAVVIPRS
jgi:hypothetical protein